MSHLMRDVEMPLSCGAVSCMEDIGFTVGTPPFLRQLGERYTQEIEQSTAAGSSACLRNKPSTSTAPGQLLGDVLFDELQLPHGQEDSARLLHLRRSAGGLAYDIAPEAITPPSQR